MTDQLPEWFLKKRLMVNDTFALSKPNLGRQSTEYSPNKRYVLAVTPHVIPGSVNPPMMEGKVIFAPAGEMVAVVRRDFPRFPVEWSMLHQHTEMDYLITSENSSGGITVFNLNRLSKCETMTGEKEDFMMLEAMVSPSDDILAVIGISFGEVPTIRFYDFKNPDKPLKEKGRFGGVFLDPKTGKRLGVLDDMIGWEDERNLMVCSTMECRKTDKKSWDEITLAEEIEALESGDHISRTDYYHIQKNGKFRLVDSEYPNLA